MPYAWDELERQLEAYRAALPSGRTGRVVVRVNHPVTEQLVPAEERTPLAGSVEQVVEDVARAMELGVDEVMRDLTQAEVPYETQLRIIEALPTARPS
jgi:hypothetical protein